ncbi:MAG: hypothetical protein RLZZ627_438 [Pseudomonadota bacterium]
MSEQKGELRDIRTHSTDGSADPGWVRFRDPSIALGLALVALPMELVLVQPAIIFFVFKASVPRWKDTFAHIRSTGKPNAELLDSLWILFHTLTGELLAPALSLVLLESGNALRDLTAGKVDEAKVDLIPSRLYWVERSGRRRRIHLKHLKKGDRVHLGAGDRIPADGVIRKGDALLDAGFLTGKSSLARKGAGDQVYASTLVSKGQLVFEIEAIGADTRVSSMLKGRLEKPEEDTRLSNYMEDLGNRAVMPALIGGAAVFIATGNINKSLAPLSLDFAQGVGIGAPIPVLRSINHNAQASGILIKGGHNLEKLAQVDAVVFDKTGTLTEQSSEIEALESFDAELTEVALLEWAVSATNFTLHPFSIALEIYAKSRGIEPMTSEVLDSSDSGVVADLQGVEVTVGTSHFLKAQGILVDAQYHRAHKSVIRDRSIRYIAMDRRVVGAISYTNPVRSEAASTIARLQEMGIACFLFTGDNGRAANAVAYKLGFKPSNTFSELSADQKVLLLERIKREHSTIAYVGDGLNDAPALVAADLGISFNDATDLARECSDVVMLNNSLQSIPAAIHSARGAMGLVRQNIAIVASANVVTVAGGVLFNMGPLLSVLINNGATVVAGLNGMRQPSQVKNAPAQADHGLIRDDQNLLGMNWRKRQRKGLGELLGDEPMEA